MEQFIARLGDKVTGVLSGFDRLRLRGTKRLLSHVRGMLLYLSGRNIQLKDFKDHAQKTTEQVRQATQALAAASGRPLLYLASAATSKEAVARKIAGEDGITSGLIAVRSCVEPCQTFALRYNGQTERLEPVMRMRKCLHYYHYFMHPVFGFMHARLQTWYPFTMHLCLNGREWLARQLDARGAGYVRRENCLVAVEDLAQAQRLLDLQLRTDWPATLDAIASLANPVESTFLGDRRVPYYWSADETEWATDILFRKASDLADLHPRLIEYGMKHFGSRDVLRFLGQKVPARSGVNGNFLGEVTSDVKPRPEGVRIKHRMNHNSVKMYDKQGSVLRVETTINDPRGLKAYRPKGSDPQRRLTWQRMRKGVADLQQRANFSQASNERYVEALASVESGETLKTLAAPVCRPVRWKGRGVRALNPLSEEDGRLLEVIARGEFINGLRNRDLRAALFGADPDDPAERRRRSGKVTRLLRMLRAHHLIVKVSHTHRYHLSAKGRSAVAAILAAQQADAKQLMAAG